MGIPFKHMVHFVTKETPDCHVLVVGDIMLDKYFYGEVTRISPEAPVPITRVVDVKETLGGAANVAHNLALLGCRTTLAGFIGKDYHGESLREQFKERNISMDCLVETAAPTTTKIRVIGGHQQMMRLDFEETRPVIGEDAELLLAKVRESLADGVQVIILSDYGKGVCTAETCAAIIALGKEHNIPVVVDPKGSDWQRYAGASFITPNLKELNEVQKKTVPNEDEAVAHAARYALSKFHIKSMVATRSECGLSLVLQRSSHHIPTKAQEVFDVSGAGDTVIATFALALAGGLKPIAGAYLANLAAGVVVGKLGTYAVSRGELLQALMREQSKR